MSEGIKESHVTAGRKTAENAMMNGRQAWESGGGAGGRNERAYLTAQSQLSINNQARIFKWVISLNGLQAAMHLHEDTPSFDMVPMPRELFLN